MKNANVAYFRITSRYVGVCAIHTKANGGGRINVILYFTIIYICVNVFFFFKYHLAGGYTNLIKVRININKSKYS